MTPILLANLNLPLPTGVRPQWTLPSVLTPTLITILVLAVATISPARKAASTKVMIVLNPAAADQPTLEELAKLRERRANYGLLVAGLILLAFCAVILFVFPILFSFGDQGAIATTFLAAFLLMVVGMSLVFYFITTPLERLLVAFYNVVNRKAAFFAGRYALRGKGRNALISLMVVASAVLPTLLATQLALTDANLETDLRFYRGASAYARSVQTSGSGIFRATSRTDSRLDDESLAELKAQPGMLKAIGSPGPSLRAIFIGEAMVTTLAAALAGIIAGAILGYALEASQRFAQKSQMLPAFDFSTAAVILVMVCLAAIFSAALAVQPVIRQKAIRILRER